MPHTTDRDYDRLIALLAESGLTQVALARALGRDERSMRRWLAGEPMPATLSQQLHKIVRISSTASKVTILIER